MSSPVFISYSSVDQSVAETICTALESRGRLDGAKGTGARVGGRPCSVTFTRQ